MGDSESSDRADQLESPEYGERVEVLSGGTEFPLGSYNCVSIPGERYIGTLIEIESNTSMEGVSALSYRVTKEPRGKFPRPTFWSRLSAMSIAVLSTILFFDIFLGMTYSAMPRWSYVIPLAAIIVGSTFIVAKRMKKFLELAFAGIELERIETLYAKPSLNLPSSKSEEIRKSVETILGELPKASLILRKPKTTNVLESTL